MSNECECINKKSEKNKSKKLVYFVLFFLSIVYLLYMFRGSLEFPLSFTRQWNCPYFYNTDENFSVVIDNQLKRLTFLDKSKKVYKTINFSYKTPILYAEEFVIHDDYVYVLGYYLNEQDLSFLGSRVVKYDKNGKFIKILYECDYTKDKNGNVYDANMILGKECLYLIEVIDDCTLDLVKVSFDGEKSEVIWAYTYDKIIFSGYYNENVKVVSIVDSIGGITSKEIFSDREFNYLLSNGNSCSSVIVFDDYNGAYISTRDMKIFFGEEDSCLEDILAFKLALSNDKLCFCDYLGNAICSYDMTTKTLVSDKYAYYSFGYLAKMILNMLAILYIFIFVVIGIFVRVKTLIREEKYQELKEKRNILVISFVVLLIPIYYSYKIYNSQFELIANRVSYTSKVSALNCPKNVKDYLSNYVDSSKNIEVNYEEILSYHNDFDAYFSSFLIDKKSEKVLDCFRVFIKSRDEYILVLDTNYDYQINIPAKLVTEIESNKVFNVENFLKSTKNKNQQGEFYCVRSQIKDEYNNEIAVVEYGMDYSYLKKMAVKRCIDYAMGLMVGIAMIYMVIKEISQFINVQIKRRKLKKQNNVIGEYLYTRQYSFFVFFVSTIDIIIAALLLRDICVQKSLSEQYFAMIVSCLPFVMYFSSTVGSILYSVLLPKFTVLRLNSFACVGMFVGVLGEFLGVEMLNIPLFFLGRIIFYIMQSIVYIMISSIADSAENEDDRYKCHKETTRASISSGVLSGAIGGYVAQYFGNKYVYVVTAIGITIIFIIGVMILPRNKKYGIINEAKTTTINNVLFSEKGLLKFVFSPRVLLYSILLALPIAIFKNYKSVLFPLFSAELDLPKVYITNLYIFGRTFNMIINSKTDKFTNVNDYRKGSSICIMMTGMFFLCFLINNTIIWAVVMIILTDFCVKIVNPMNKMIISKDAEFNGLNRDKVKGVVEILVSFVSCLQAPLMAFFLTFGSDMACVFVGVFCGVCGLIYAIFSGINKKKVKQSSLSQS